MKLPSNIISQTDLAGLIFELKRYEKWFAHTSIKQSVQANPASATAPSLSDAALGIVKNNETLLNKQQLEQVIWSLEDLLDSSPAITITLAAPAPQSLKISLANWCRNNLAADTLVNFRFNATLLGGMVVQCGSHIYDWSWRRAILNNRGAFAEVLRRV